MSLFLSLRSEWLKIKHTSSVPLCILAAAIVPVFSLIRYCTDRRAAGMLTADPWNLYFAAGRQGFGLLVLPLYIVLLCTLLPQIEYRNHTWKQVFVSPQPFSRVLLSKFLIVHGFILLLLMAYNGFMVSTAILIHFCNPGTGFFRHSIHWHQWLAANVDTYVSVLGISAVQFWAGIRFRNRIIPAALGLCLVTAAALAVLAFGRVHAGAFPLAYTLLTLLPRQTSGGPAILWSPVAFAAAFLGLAFADFSRSKIRE